MWGIAAERWTEEVRRVQRRSREIASRRNVHPYLIASLSRVREATEHYPGGVAPAATLSQSRQREDKRAALSHRINYRFQAGVPTDISFGWLE